MPPPSRRAFLSLLVAAPVLSAPRELWADDEELVVIVNADNDIKSLDAQDLSRIFRMKTRTWPGGGRVQPFNMPANHDLRETFDRAVLHMDPKQVARYWIDQKVRGGARPPRPVQSVRLMAAVVGQLEEAIGYLPASEAKGNVRVVARIRAGKLVER